MTGQRRLPQTDDMLAADDLRSLLEQLEPSGMALSAHDRGQQSGAGIAQLLGQLMKRRLTPSVETTEEFSLDKGGTGL